MEKISRSINYYGQRHQDKNSSSGQCKIREPFQEGKEPSSYQESKIDTKTTSTYTKRITKEDKRARWILMAKGGENSIAKCLQTRRLAF